jgi:hypothetical protein
MMISEFKLGPVFTGAGVCVKDGGVIVEEEYACHMGPRYRPL